MDSELPGILIVDDNEDNRYTLQLLLETDGHERIASASGGNEAIALLDKEKFSLVLLDMMMPDLNGDEVLKIIKGNPDTRDIPVVMISADSDTEKVSKCIELGADDYLPKPFNPTILRARIGSALRQGSLRALQTEYVGKMEQAKKESDGLLRNLFPPEIAARLRNGDSNIADHFEDATVIFADVVGFGKITARMKAYEVVGCLNRLFSEFDQLAEDVGVEKIKTIGDNYMAVAGVPTPRSGHGRIAAKLALDMIERGMAHILAVHHVDHVLADVLGMIADTLQSAHDPHDFEGPSYGAGVLHHERDALTVDRFVLFVHHPVFLSRSHRCLRVHAGKCVQRIVHHVRDLPP